MTNTTPTTAIVTDRSRCLVRVAVLLAVLTATIIPFGMVAGTAAPETRTADLAVQQPSYVNSSVSVTEQNGTRVYHVQGSEIELAPVNFDSGNVVAYGVATAGGELAYQSEFREYVFKPTKTGTYTLYWTVERTVTVNNSTGNGTREVTRQYRYEARIRVDGKLDMVHQPAGTLAQLRSDARQWREFNASIQPLRQRGMFVSLGFKDPPSTDDLVQGMINAWLVVHDPIGSLSGDFTVIVFMIASTLGGWLFLLFVILPLVLSNAYLYYRYQRKESIEAAEGTLARRIADFEQRVREQALANKPFTSIYGDDHLAGAMREEGRNPVQAVTNFRSKLRPRYLMHAQLQAMAASGWVAVVDDRTTADSDSDGSESVADRETIRSAHVAREETVNDDADVVSLEMDSPDDPLLDALDWSQREIIEFDSASADFDRSEIQSTPIDVYDLDELMELTEADMRQFESVDDAAEIYMTLFEEVREHPLTDDNGVPDTLRYWLEQHLDAANVLNDRFEMPYDIYVRIFERALVDYDEGEQARDTLSDVREGAYAD